MNTPARHSEIYDLGYRNYDGPRLGRRYAVRSLGALSLRNTFGFGRGVTPKIIAFALTLFALVPALIQLAIGAIIPSDEIDFEYVRPHEYYGFVQTILVLFVASMASELVGNDRKNNTLPLYFSRPIERSDYVLAKGIGITNLVAVATARADELTAEQLHEGGARLRRLVAERRPAVVAMLGLTAYRQAFGVPNAPLGPSPDGFEGAELWLLPNPSGLNAHHTVGSLAAWYRRAAQAAGVSLDR